MDGNTLIKLLNTGLNPIEYRAEKVLRIPGQSPRAAALTRGAALALGLGTATALARTMMRDSGEDKRKEQLKAWAGARFPVISADPSLQDDAQEKRLAEAGVGDIAEIPELDKIGQEDEGADDSMLPGVIPRLGGLLAQIGGGTQSVDEPMVAALASAGGIYGGYKLADYIADARRKSEMENQIADRKQNIDKLIYDEYLRTRGIQKKAQQGDMYSHEDATKGPSVGQAFWNDPARFSSRTLATGFSLWAAASLALAYKYSKDYHDENDPSRQRIKQLQTAARARAKQKQAPMFLEGGGLPEIGQGTIDVKPAPPKRPARVSTTPGINTADPTDPLGSILAK